MVGAVEREGGRQWSCVRVAMFNIYVLSTSAFCVYSISLVKKVNNGPWDFDGACNVLVDANWPRVHCIIIYYFCPSKVKVLLHLRRCYCVASPVEGGGTAASKADPSSSLCAFENMYMLHL